VEISKIHPKQTWVSTWFLALHVADDNEVYPEDDPKAGTSQKKL